MPPAAGLALGLVVGACGVAPDIDKPREHGHRGEIKHGACAAEAHHFVSRWLSEIVSHACGGHRCKRHWWSTHRVTCAVAVGAALTVLTFAQPRWTLTVVVAVTATWPLYLVLPWRGDHRPRRSWLGSRDSAWLFGLALAAAAYIWATPTLYTGLAVGLGWALHIWCDHLQSALFKIGGLVEQVIAWSSLAGATALVIWQVTR